jgi:transposase-like protein
MARRRLCMRQIKRVLELRHEHGLSIREIARSLGVPISTIGDYLQQAREAGLSWPLPEGLDERDLHERLRQAPEETEAQRPLPDGDRCARSSRGRR